jgi:hypothetical protein
MEGVKSVLLSWMLIHHLFLYKWVSDLEYMLLSSCFLNYTAIFFGHLRTPSVVAYVKKTDFKQLSCS